MHRSVQKLFNEISGQRFYSLHFRCHIRVDEDGRVFKYNFRDDEDIRQLARTQVWGPTLIESLHDDWKMYVMQEY